MGYESISAELKARASEVASGQTTFQAIGNEIRNRSYGASLLSDRQLRSIAAQYAPGAAKTLSRKEQRQRAALSERARNAVIDYFVKRAESDIPNRYNIQGENDRSFQHLYDYSGTKEADEYNVRAITVLRQGSPKEKSDFIHDRCMNTIYPAIVNALDMSASDLIENYANIYEHISFIEELVALYKPLPFTPEQRKDLQRLDSLMSSAAELLARVDMIAAPQFKSLSLEQLPGAGQDKCVDFQQHIRDTAQERGDFIANPNEEDPRHCDGPLGTIADAVVSVATFQKESYRSRVEHSIVRQGGDQRLIYSTQGKLIDAGDLGEHMFPGEPVFTLIPGRGMVPVFPVRSWDPPRINDDPSTTVPAMGTYMADRARSMLQQLKGADPWWMSTGSKEYSNLEQAMESFVRLNETISYPPSAQDAERLKTATANMKECSEQYLAYKMSQAKPPVIDGKTGAYKGKNARETARLQAAAAVEDIVTQMNFIIDCGAYPQKGFEKGAEDSKRLDGAKNPKRPAQPEQANAQVENLPQEERCSTQREALIQKASGMVPPVQPEFEGDMLPALQQNAARSAIDLAKLASMNKSLSSRDLMVRQYMGRIITLRLIQLERMEWKNTHPNEKLQPGPMEQQLMSKQGDSLIHNSTLVTKSGQKVNPFNDLVGKLTPASLENFIMNDGAKSLTKQYLDHMTQLGKERSGDGPHLKKSEISAEKSGNEAPNPSVMGSHSS